MREETEQAVRQMRALLDSILVTLNDADLQEKRGKLRAIKVSIQQLERKEVPVPEDLRQMRARLSAELGDENEAEECLSIMFRELSNMLTRIENYNSTAGMHHRSRRKRRSKRRHRSSEDKKNQGFLRRLF